MGVMSSLSCNCIMGVISDVISARSVDQRRGGNHFCIKILISSLQPSFISPPVSQTLLGTALASLPPFLPTILTPAVILVVR